jgi:hypothetical protein
LHGFFLIRIAKMNDPEVSGGFVCAIVIFFWKRLSSLAKIKTQPLSYSATQHLLTLPPAVSCRRKETSHQCGNVTISQFANLFLRSDKSSNYHYCWNWNADDTDVKNWHGFFLIRIAKADGNGFVCVTLFILLKIALFLSKN